LIPAVLLIWIRIGIHMFLGLPDPDPLVRGTDSDQETFYRKAKIVRKFLIPTDF